jgi:hypothetical protein
VGGWVGVVVGGGGGFTWLPGFLKSKKRLVSTNPKRMISTARRTPTSQPNHDEGSNKVHLEGSVCATNSENIYRASCGFRISLRGFPLVYKKEKATATQSVTGSVALTSL